MCLVETQEKYNKITERENLEKIVSRRKIEDKKGGGIMLLKRKNNGIKLDKLKEIHPDILTVKCQIGNMNFILITTYIKCNPKENKDIYDAINRILKKHENEPIFMIGDMNAHTNITIKDKVNQNGKKLLEWVDKYNLVMLNNDIECKGKYTWEARNSKTVIDYALMNEKMYSYFSQMMIDENKEIIDISDHMMIEIVLNTKNDKNKITEHISDDREYYTSLNQEKIKTFVENFEERLRNIEDQNLEKFDELIEELSDKLLKTKIVKSRRKEKGKIEPIWLNKEIKNEIKNRKKYNKLKRNCLNEIEKDYFESKYLEHKEKVKLMVKNEITKYEIKITDEIKADKNRRLWQNINYLRGKNKITKQQNYIYKENGEKIEDPKRQIKEFWSEIYSKRNNNTQKNWSETKDRYKNILQNETLEIDNTRFHYSLQ